MATVALQGKKTLPYKAIALNSAGVKTGAKNPAVKRPMVQADGRYIPTYGVVNRGEELDRREDQKRDQVNSKMNDRMNYKIVRFTQSFRAVSRPVLKK